MNRRQSRAVPSQNLRFFSEKEGILQEATSAAERTPATLIQPRSPHYRVHVGSLQGDPRRGAIAGHGPAPAGRRARQVRNRIGARSREARQDEAGLADQE